MILRVALAVPSLGAMLVLACGPSEPPRSPPPPVEAPKACTQEAKICPDGTVVSRTLPMCEFAPCPGDGGAADLTPTTVEP